MTPLKNTELARLMDGMAPFEQNPHIAVAVSGGPDSLALTLLADTWARNCGGRLTALTVDHGLRPESGAEAARVGGWLEDRGIEHRILVWHGAKPATGIQAAARDARYHLMSDWCRENGVLHLLLAHHLEDQAETFLLRLAGDSGIDGLAAMASIIEKPSLRLLRPLLNVPKDRLKAYLEQQGQPCIEDPSNEDTGFARVRIRKSLPGLASAGVTPAALAATAAGMARARIALEQTAATLLSQSCHVTPAGYAGLDAAKLFAAPDEISLRVLSRTLLCIGGGLYGPGTAKLEHLHDAMKKATLDGAGNWRGATLSRCRIGPAKGYKGFIVCRENRNLPQPMTMTAGESLIWDRRFRVRMSGGKDLRLANLGAEGWQQVMSAAPQTAVLRVPVAARASLPALWRGDDVVQVPHLDYREKDASATLNACFRPLHSLSGVGFMVAL